jgi:prepilin-type N-terminal cleavage/methylation domain-containing protein
MSASRRRGFSLLEVLVVAGLMAVVLGILWMTFFSGTTGIARAGDRLEVVGEFNRAVAYLRRDLLALHWAPELPIRIADEGDGRVVRFHVVEGVTLEGLPVVVPVTWRSRGGEGEATLERVYSPGLGGEATTSFMAGNLGTFEVAKLDDSGGRLPGSDETLPALLEARIRHAAGDELLLRLPTPERLRIQDSGGVSEAWFPNRLGRPVPPTFDVIAPRPGGVEVVAMDGETLTDSALLASGREMALPRQQLDP